MAITPSQSLAFEPHMVAAPVRIRGYVRRPCPIQYYERNINDAERRWAPDCWRGFAMREIYRRLAQSPGSSLAALGGLLAVATVALFLTGLEARYRDRIAVAKSDALSFANILAEHTVLTFEDVDRALRRAQAIRGNSLSGKFDPA